MRPSQFSVIPLLTVHCLWLTLKKQILQNPTVPSVEKTHQAKGLGTLLLLPSGRSWSEYPGKCIPKACWCPDSWDCESGLTWKWGPSTCKQLNMKSLVCSYKKKAMSWEDREHWQSQEGMVLIYWQAKKCQGSVSPRKARKRPGRTLPRLS